MFKLSKFNPDHWFYQTGVLKIDVRTKHKIT